MTCTVPSLFDTAILLKKTNFNGSVTVNKRTVGYNVNIRRNLTGTKCFVRLSSNDLQTNQLRTLQSSLRTHLVLGGNPQELEAFLQISLSNL